MRSELVLLRFVPVLFVSILSQSAGEAGLDFSTALGLERNRPVPFHTASGRVLSGPGFSGPVLSGQAQSGPNQLHGTRPLPSKQQPISSSQPNPVGSCSAPSGPVQSSPSGPVRSSPVQSKYAVVPHKAVRSVPRDGR